mmetsp:Transcript_56855/g.124731  ORF Transcript_56855/g.124731 Transcript_56855/m.124731 type:complete len:206 (+) Transcript_56855:212-829(+)
MSLSSLRHTSLTFLSTSQAQKSQTASTKTGTCSLTLPSIFRLNSTFSSCVSRVSGFCSLANLLISNKALKACNAEVAERFVSSNPRSPLDHLVGATQCSPRILPLMVPRKCSALFWYTSPMVVSSWGPKEVCDRLCASNTLSRAKASSSRACTNLCSRSLSDFAQPTTRRSCCRWIRRILDKGFFSPSALSIFICSPRWAAFMAN